MRDRRYLRLVLRVAVSALFLCLVAGWLHAQSAGPPIRIVFPFAAGGSGDTLARLIADKMQTAFKRTVIVENRTGASGRVGIRDVKASKPDGDTLLLTPIAPMSVYPHVYATLDYDPLKDFAPIAELGTFDFGIAVDPRLKINTVAELIAWAKANPSRANYAIPGVGTLPHFLGVLLAHDAKIDLRPVPYRGSAAGLADVLAGQIPMIFTTASDLVEMDKAGRIRVLATSGRGRSPFMPNVPTLKESGYDLVATGWYGMFAPANTPPDVIARLNTAIVDAVRSHDVEARLVAMGLQPTGTSPASFAKIVEDDSEMWAPAVEESGFKPGD